MTTRAIALAAALAASASLWAGEDIQRQQAAEHHRRGQELMRAERFELAVEEFQKAIALDPLLFMAHYNLGQAHMALKSYVSAVQAYHGAEQAILKTGSLDLEAREQRDRQNRDEIDELKSLARTLQNEAARQDARGGGGGGAVDGRVTQIEERIRMLEGMRLKGQEAVRVPAELSLALGSAYFRQNKLTEAEAAYVKAVKGDGKLGPAHNNLAVIYMLSGRFPEAKSSVEAAEKAGFHVDPRLKADLKAREAAARPQS
jgi:tetratricopeptide (TPR) repeat protein